MHNNHSQRVFPVLLPMAVAQDLHTGFDFDQTFFGWKQWNSPGQKEAGDGLDVSATQTASRHKFSYCRLRSSHNLILNGYENIKA
jgi:hypothetical protein